MNLRPVTAAAFLLAITSATGCAESKYGEQMRVEANDRMGLVNAQIAYDQAERAFETGQFDKAMRQIDGAIGRYPDAADYHVLRGRIFLETHRLEPAIEAFLTAIEKDESSATAHYFAALVFERWSDDEEAYEHFRQAFENDATNAQYLLAAAESLVIMGEFDSARHMVEEKIAYFEYNAALHQLLGQIALLEGRPAAAADFFQESRTLGAEDDLVLLEELAWAQYDAGRYSACRDTVIELQSLLTEERPDLMHLEARCLGLLGHTVEARNLFLELTRVRPSDPEVWISLGLLARDLGDFRRVASCSVRVVALAPNRYEGYMLKGMNERHHGNLPEAIKLYRASSRLCEESALPHLLLGQCLRESGDFDGAFAAFARAQEIEPDNPATRSIMTTLTQSPELDRPE
jgi:tetratricopeptide (TPR) repeat protein